MSRTLTISKETVVNRTRKLGHAESLTEYVINGLDAGATRIDINYKTEALGGISIIEIIDNGSGISYENLNNTFEVFGASQKKSKKTTSNTTGKNGIGRLCFYKFAMNASWETVYKGDKELKEYVINISSGLLNEYDPTIPKTSTKKPGTKVIFKNIQGELSDKNYIEKDFIDYLIKKIAWRLELTKAKIYINSKEVDYSSVIQNKLSESITVHHDDLDQDFSFDLIFIKWSSFISIEESRFYFISNSDEEKLKQATGLNKNNDDFFHSLYVKGDYFDNFTYIENEINNDGSSLFNQNGYFTQKDKFFSKLKTNLRNYLEKIRKPYLKQKAKEYINELDTKNIFDAENGSAIAEYKNQTIKETIEELYVVNPSIVKKLNDAQKKIFFRMMGTILEEGEGTKLFSIIEHTLDLTKEEREKFSQILENIQLKNIIKTIDLITDRLGTLKILEQFITNKTLGANEVTHLQGLISQHYWIFGEEYALLGDAEDDFIENLRKFHYLLTGETQTRKQADMDSEDKNKELDILMCKTEINSENDLSKMKNVIVELKHPNIKLGSKEHAQIITYFQTILKEPRFNGKGFEWKFYLIGNNYDEYIETQFRSNESHGRDVILRDPKNNYTVYCKNRSDVLMENKTRLEFLRKKLDVSYKVIAEKSNIDSVEDGMIKINNSAIQDNTIQLDK